MIRASTYAFDNIADPRAAVYFYTFDGIVCWHSCCWPGFLHPVEYFQLKSNWHAYRYRNVFFLFPSDNKERRRRAEAKWKKQTEATGFCLYSVNRVDPSLAPIFPPNSELRKTLKKRDVLAAPDVSTSSSGNLLAKVVSRVVFLFKLKKKTGPSKTFTKNIV